MWCLSTATRATATPSRVETNSNRALELARTPRLQAPSARRAWRREESPRSRRLARCHHRTHTSHAPRSHRPQAVARALTRARRKRIGCATNSRGAFPASPTRTPTPTRALSIEHSNQLSIEHSNHHDRPERARESREPRSRSRSRSSSRARHCRHRSAARDELANRQRDARGDDEDGDGDDGDDADAGEHEAR